MPWASLLSNPILIVEPQFTLKDCFIKVNDFPTASPSLVSLIVEEFPEGLLPQYPQPSTGPENY